MFSATYGRGTRSQSNSVRHDDHPQLKRLLKRTLRLGDAVGFVVIDVGNQRICPNFEQSPVLCALESTD